MQNSSIIYHFSLKYFLSISACFQRSLGIRIATLLLSAAGLTVQAQVVPSTGVSPTAPSAGASQSGRALPAGANTSNLPASIQQQINQRTGGGQTPGRNVSTGRTSAQPTNRTTRPCRPDDSSTQPTCLWTTSRNGSYPYT